MVHPEINPYGNRPMALIFQIPTPSATSWHTTYTNLTCNNWEERESDWKRSKAWFVFIKPIKGFLNAIKTIMILKIWRELPDMYIMMAVMGRPLTGASATSQAFLSFKVSISAVVGGLRG